MTAHVAEAGEGRGRVILRCSDRPASSNAIEAALLVAEAFHSEVEVLFVEDRQRVDFSGFSFAVEYSARGGPPRSVSPLAVHAEMRSVFALTRKRVAMAASALGVKVYEHTVRDDPVQALASACARRGPWNIIAIAEPLSQPHVVSLDELFETVSDATGVIIVGPSARTIGLSALRLSHSKPVIRRSALQSPSRAATAALPSPVILAVEDTDRLQGMLRAGRYIAAALKTEVVVALIADTEEELIHMEGKVRLVLAGEPNVRLARTTATYRQTAAIAEMIRRLDGSFLIAQFGGVAVPGGKPLGPLVTVLGCPVLLVR